MVLLVSVDVAAYVSSCGVCRRTSPLPSFAPGGDCDVFSDGNFG